MLSLDKSSGHDKNSADWRYCLDGISACRLFDYNGQLADEVGDLLEFGIVMMIDRMGQTLDTLVVTDGRNASMI
jgi:hypothetical protein